MDSDQAAELVRISAALITAIAEARALAVRRDFGADLLELMQHARELHDIALEVVAGEPDPGELARGVAKAIGERVAELEAMLAEKPPRRPLH